MTNQPKNIKELALYRVYLTHGEGYQVNLLITSELDTLQNALSKAKKVAKIKYSHPKITGIERVGTLDA